MFFFWHEEDSCRADIFLGNLRSWTCYSTCTEILSKKKKSFPQRKTDTKFPKANFLTQTSNLYKYHLTSSYAFHREVSSQHDIALHRVKMFRLFSDNLMAIIRQSLLNCAAQVRDLSTRNLFRDYFAMFPEFLIENYKVLIDGAINKISVP